MILLLSAYAVTVDMFYRATVVEVCDVPILLTVNVKGVSHHSF
jgi:hypothetical protein